MEEEDYCYYCYNHSMALWIWSRTNWVAGTRSNIHSLTPIVVISHPLFASFIYYDPWHPPCLIYMPDSLFCTLPVQVSFGLAPTTSYSIHFFTQSLSSFHTTRPNHRKLFFCSTEIMSSNPNFSTLYSELYLLA